MVMRIAKALASGVVLTALVLAVCMALITLIREAGTVWAMVFLLFVGISAVAYLTLED